jgi:hypothetical protein
MYLQVTLPVEQIDQVIIGAIITLILTLIGTVASYIFTKRKEIDASIRQNKTERYDELVKSLTIVVKKKITEDIDSINEFIMAYNRASTYANDDVIEACNNFLEGLGTKELNDQIVTDLVNAIYLAIRRDINPKARKIDFRTFFVEPIDD